MSVYQDDHSLAILFSKRLVNLKNQTAWPANFIRISEEQWENDKMLFYLSEDIGSRKIRGYKQLSLHIVFVTCSMGTIASLLIVQCLKQFWNSTYQ